MCTSASATPQTTLSVQKKSNPYRMVDIRAVEDTRLSCKAVGLLVRLLIKPTGWQINMKHLQRTYPEGGRALRSAMKELQEAGYATLITIYDDDDKRASGKRWVISDYPRNIEKRTLPKALEDLSFSETKAEMHKTSKSGNVKVWKRESLKSATHRSITTKGSSKEEKQIKENTHTQNEKRVCVDKNNFEKKPIHNKQSSANSRSGKGNIAADQRLNIELPEGVERLADLAEDMTERFLQYLRTDGMSKYITRLNHLERTKIVRLYFSKLQTEEKYSELIAPDYQNDRENFERWFAKTWNGLKKYHDSYCINHSLEIPNPTKPRLAPPQLTEAQQIERLLNSLEYNSELQAEAEALAKDGASVADLRNLILEYRKKGRDAQRQKVKRTAEEMKGKPGLEALIKS